jgi:hypothetical protein
MKSARVSDARRHADRTTRSSRILNEAGPLDRAVERSIGFLQLAGDQAVGCRWRVPTLPLVPPRWAGLSLYCHLTERLWVAHLGADLGVATTAEGVETKEELEQVRAEGCTEIQGFYICKPAPADVVSKIFFAESTKAASAA